MSSMLSLPTKTAPRPEAFYCSMDPVDRTRDLLPGNGRKGSIREKPSCRSHMRTVILVSGD